MDIPNPDQQLVLSICSGGGGLDRGVRLAVPAARTVGYVEIEIPAAACLVAHMEAGTLDPAPVWTNLRTFNWGRFRGAMDGLIGGYPCQPFSTAGKRQGAADPRHLWPLIREGIPQCEPNWCFFENVSNHLNIGFDVVARELQDLGYDVAATLLTAAEVGATHKRERLFILAVRDMEHTPSIVQHAEQKESPAAVGGRTILEAGTGRSGEGQSLALVHSRGQQKRAVSVQQPLERRGRDLADTHRSSAIGDMVYADHARLQGRGESIVSSPYELPAWPPGPADDAAWADVLARFPDLAPAIEPAVRGMAHGMVPRVDRLRLLGNGVVPLQAAIAFRSLAEDLKWV